MHFPGFFLGKNQPWTRTAPIIPHHINFFWGVRDFCGNNCLFQPTWLKLFQPNGCLNSKSILLGVKTSLFLGFFRKGFFTNIRLDFVSLEIGIVKWRNPIFLKNALQSIQGPRVHKSVGLELWHVCPFFHCFSCLKIWGEERQDWRVCIRSRDPTGRVPVQIYCGWRVVPGHNLANVRSWRKGAEEWSWRGAKNLFIMGNQGANPPGFDQHILGNFSWKISIHTSHHERTFAKRTSRSVYILCQDGRSRFTFRRWQRCGSWWVVFDGTGQRLGVKNSM